ncbi:MAG: protein kinase, partial [Deltaproteobacteria bacterium]|nr:protein kinase [Deltaproteobacteria bacterium]
VIHRDIKPSNIMINKNGAIKITDFGIAQMIEETAKIGIYGTPGYMSPEQLKETIATGQSDIFSVGCVMYELLTGQKAFTGKNLFSIMYKIINEEPESILTLRPELPEVLDEIIKKALAKEVKDRYQNCTEMAYYIRMALRTISGAVKKEKDIVEIIHNVPFFRHFTKDQVRELVAASEILKAISGKMIVSEGDIDDTFFIILSGKAQVMKNGNKVASIGVGECFGEMSYIANQARSASVVAETDCILMKISATLLNKSSESIQLLFFKNFAMTLVRRLSASAEKKK